MFLIVRPAFPSELIARPNNAIAAATRGLKDLILMSNPPRLIG
jgi:hypothetical protein